MRDILPRVSEEQLPLVQVTPYHPHNSVNLLMHLLQEVVKGMWYTLNEGYRAKGALKSVLNNIGLIINK